MWLWQTCVHARLLWIFQAVLVHWKPVGGSLTLSEKQKITLRCDAQPGVSVCVCVSVCMIWAYRMQNTPISPPIGSRALPWWCIPGQGLAVISTDPGWWPLTFRPWPGSKGQRWPEGNKSTSMIGTRRCSLPPSSAALTSLPPMFAPLICICYWAKTIGCRRCILLLCIVLSQVAMRGSILYHLHSVLLDVPDFSTSVLCKLEW